MIWTYENLRVEGDPGDIHMYEEIFVSDSYRVKSRLGPGAKVLDLGGCKGYFSLLAASCGADVRVYEPRPDNFGRLVANIQTNGLSSKIQAVCVGVWSEGGVTRSLDNPFHTQAEAVEAGALGNTGGCPLEITNPLEHIAGAFPDGIITGPIVSLVSFSEALGSVRWDIVKMDVEGSEHELISKATDKMLAQIDFLTFEFHGHLGLEKLADILSKLAPQFDLDRAGGHFYATRKKCLLYQS